MIPTITRMSSVTFPRLGCPGHKPHPRTRDGAVNSLVSTGEAVGEPESRGTTFASRRPLGVEGKPGPAFGLQWATGESRGPQAAR
jgi:hypothetical protein